MHGFQARWLTCVHLRTTQCDTGRILKSEKVWLLVLNYKLYSDEDPSLEQEIYRVERQAFLPVSGVSGLCFEPAMSKGTASSSTNGRRALGSWEYVTSGAVIANCSILLRKQSGHLLAVAVTRAWKQSSKKVPVHDGRVCGTGMQVPAPAELDSVRLTAMHSCTEPKVKAKADVIIATEPAVPLSLS